MSAIRGVEGAAAGAAGEPTVSSVIEQLTLNRVHINILIAASLGYVFDSFDTYIVSYSMPSIVKDNPFWLDPKDPHVVAQTQQAVLGTTLPQFWVYNPAYAQVQNEHTFMTGWMDIIQGGMAPQAAAEKALKRVAEIFAKFPIA